MTTELTKQALLNGETFSFSNEVYQETIGSDDIRIATVSFGSNNKNCFLNGFKIEFNGALIYSGKTFPFMMKRLQKLIKKWNLKQTNN